MPKVGDVLGNFRFKGLDEKAHSVSEYRGKHLLIDFWASCCTPCVKAIPDVKKLNEKIADSENVAILSISLDKDISIVRDLVKKKGDDVESRERGRHPID